MFADFSDSQNLIKIEVSNESKFEIGKEIL